MNVKLVHENDGLAIAVDEAFVNKIDLSAEMSLDVSHRFIARADIEQQVCRGCVRR